MALDDDAMAERPQTGEAAAREAGRWRRRGFKADTSDLSLHSPIRATLLLIPYLIATLILIPLQAISVALGSRMAERIPVVYHRCVCWLFGLEIVLRGTPEKTRPTLFVANHSSYIDIEVFSALIPVSFIAKSEVASWPFFGTLARLQRTVFVDRQPRSTADQRDAISRRLAVGDNLMLFPEGTSSDGTRVLPFRSALFGVAQLRRDERPIAVQSVAIAYTRLDGIPLGRYWRPLFAWFGDLDLVPHLWQMVCLGETEAVVTFFPPVDIAQLGDRKKRCEYCFRQVSRPVQGENSGRYELLPPRKKAA